MPDLTNVLAVMTGAAVGALVRWGLSLSLNAAWPSLPLGTLTANLIGALLMGMMLAALTFHGEQFARWQPLIATGFLGGLTTFSTFSGEIFTQLQHNKWGAAALGITSHVAGSLVCTALGFALVRMWTVSTPR